MLPEGVQLDFAFVDDNEDSNSSAMLRLYGAAVLESEKRPPDALYNVDGVTHQWAVSTFEHLARQKQRLIEHAKAGRYTYIWFVDSDLLCESSTLRVLLASNVDIANGVFWTRWTPEAPPLPQIWQQHPYGMEGLGWREAEFLEVLGERQLVRVAGGGACTLMRMNIFEGQSAPRYYPRLGGLPDDGMWQGEDRTFALTAERARCVQYADGWPDIFHAYHIKQRTPEMLEQYEELLSAPRQTAAGYGDLVALTISPLTDQALQDQLRPEARAVRGRLGALRLLPELEVALMGMTVGTQRIVEVRYPASWPLQPYRGKHGLLLVELLDAKPMGYAPVLAEDAFAALESR